MNGLFHHIVVEIRGKDHLLGVVRLDSGFDVSNLNTSVLVAFMRSIAGEKLNGRPILPHCCCDEGYGPNFRGGQA